MRINELRQHIQLALILHIAGHIKHGCRDGNTALLKLRKNLIAVYIISKIDLVLLPKISIIQKDIRAI